MATPKAKPFQPKLMYKKRNQSAVDIEKDLNIMEQQQMLGQADQAEHMQGDLSSEAGNQNFNNNNYSFDQNKNPNYFIRPSEQFFGNNDKKTQDNLDYLNSLVQKSKIQEQRNNKKAAMHARTKSSLGQYSTSSSSQPQQQAYPNQHNQNHQNMLTNAQRAEREAMSNQNSFDNQSKTHRISSVNGNDQEIKDNSGMPLIYQPPPIQQKSLSHRSLNETLPIFSKQNKQSSQISDKNGDALQKSTHSISQGDGQKAHGQTNNLSFKIDSERKSIQQQYQSQQQQHGKITNSESLSGNETNHSTGISVQKTDQAQFLQFLGNYVTYLSQPDESPSYVSSRPSQAMYQNNFLNSYNSNTSNNNNRYHQHNQILNIQMQNEELLKENFILKQKFEQTLAEKKDLQIQIRRYQIEIDTAKKEKNMAVKLEREKYEEVLFNLKYTQENLAKVTIDRENIHATLLYALSRQQQNKQKNSDVSSFKSNSKNSYSSQNFNFTSKGRKESMNDLNDFENNSHFFSVHNQKYPQQQKMSQIMNKSPMNYSKTPLSMNRSNFQQENIYEGDAIMNNTGIFNYPNQQLICEEGEEIDQHNMSIKPQVINQNLSNFGQVPNHEEEEIEYDMDENVYQNQYDGEPQYQEYEQHDSSQNFDKPSFINYGSTNQIAAAQLQRNKKYHSHHIINPSSEEKGNINQSFYQNQLQNKKINDINNKALIQKQIQQQEQMQNMLKFSKQDTQQYKSKGNILKNSSTNVSSSSKTHFNSSNLMIPSCDYYQDISQSELQNNSLQLHQLE